MTSAIFVRLTSLTEKETTGNDVPQQSKHGSKARKGCMGTGSSSWKKNKDEEQDDADDDNDDEAKYSKYSGLAMG